MSEFHSLTFNCYSLVAISRNRLDHSDGTAEFSSEYQIDQISVARPSIGTRSCYEACRRHSLKDSLTNLECSSSNEVTEMFTNASHQRVRRCTPTKIACYALLSSVFDERYVSYAKFVEFPRLSSPRRTRANRKDLPICRSQFESGYKSE